MAGSLTDEPSRSTRLTSSRGPRRDWPSGRSRRGAALGIPARIGGFVLLLALAATIWGQMAPPYDPLVQDFASRLGGPSLAHPLGQDQYGRDVLSRLLAGAAPSLFVATTATALAVTVGVPLGAVCALGGWIGRAISRLTDGVQAFPALLLALILVTAVGSSYATVILSIGFSFVPLLARVSEAVVIAESRRDYTVAAQAIGMTQPRVFLRHVLPNAAGPLLVQATTVLALAILVEASLSFLGLGPSISSPTWGRMLFDARSTMELAPHTAIAPLMAVSGLVLAINLLGDGLRDSLDPVVSAQRVA